MTPQQVYERILADRPPDSNLGPVRARRPGQVAEMRRLRAAGVAISAIAYAYELSVRTVYRYLDRGDDDEEVTVLGWRAWFGLSESGQPVRITPWERAE